MFHAMQQMLKTAPWVLLTVFITLSGCSQPTQQTTAPPTAIAPASQAVAQSSSTKFKGENGADLFSLKLMPDGAKLVDASNKELARLNVDDRSKVKIKNAADKVLGYVVPERDYWKVKNANQSQELYVLRRQPDGDYKLERGSNQPLYRIKVRDYGFEIETPTKQSLYKVKVKGDKISLRNAQDKTVLYTKGNFLPIAVACFGFEDLSREQKAALAYAVNRSGGQ